MTSIDSLAVLIDHPYNTGGKPETIGCLVTRDGRSVTPKDDVQKKKMPTVANEKARFSAHTTGAQSELDGTSPAHMETYISMNGNGS